MPAPAAPADELAANEDLQQSAAAPAAAATAAAATAAAASLAAPFSFATDSNDDEYEDALEGDEDALEDGAGTDSLSLAAAASSSGGTGSDIVLIGD